MIILKISTILFLLLGSLFPLWCLLFSLPSLWSFYLHHCPSFKSKQFSLSILELLGIRYPARSRPMEASSEEEEGWRAPHQLGHSSQWVYMGGPSHNYSSILWPAYWWLIGLSYDTFNFSSFQKNNVWVYCFLFYNEGSKLCIFRVWRVINII